MLALFIPGEPVAFARARLHGKRHFTPDKQAVYMQVVAHEARQAMCRAGMPLIRGPVFLQLRATYALPESWPAKKKERAIWKTSKPDADNLAKLQKDALTGIVYRDDAQVVKVHAEKRYGLPIGVTIVVHELDGEEIAA